MIRYTKDYNKEIRRIVGNYNKRVSRANLLNVPAPAKIKVSELKATYYKRKDLNRKLKELQLFNIRDSRKLNIWGGSQYEENLAKFKYTAALAEIKARITYAKRKENAAVNYVDSNRFAYQQTKKRLMKLRSRIGSGKASKQEFYEFRTLTNDLSTGVEQTVNLRKNLLKMLNSYASWVGVSYEQLQKALDKVANLNLDRLDSISKYNNLFKNWLDNYSIMMTIDDFDDASEDEAPYQSGDEAISELLRSLSDDIVIDFA